MNYDQQMNLNTKYFLYAALHIGQTKLFRFDIKLNSLGSGKTEL